MMRKKEFVLSSLAASRTLDRLANNNAFALMNTQNINLKSSSYSTVNTNTLRQQFNITVSNTKYDKTKISEDHFVK